MNYPRFWYLVDLYHKKQLSDEQLIELEEIYALLNNNSNLYNEVLNQADSDEALINRLQQDFNSKYLPNKKSNFRKYSIPLAVAATLIIALSFGILFFKKSTNGNLASKGKTTQKSILPAKDVAYLTFSSGESIALTEKNYHLARNNFRVGKGIIYFEEAENAEVINQTLTAPKGGKYEVVMADGTHVWLNADTKISFPSKFTGAERTVELTGEAYFEVAKNLDKPFIVKTGTQILRVLGTHFNLNAYAGAAIKTTLFEGKVKVSTKEKENGVDILPGQQTIFTANSFVLQNADLKEALAWKNGYFKFNSENIEGIMLQLARWYNVDVVYKTSISNKTISAYISREKSLKEVLEILEATESVKFNVERRTIYVTN